MSTLDRTVRSWVPLQTLPEGLWKQFEGSSASNINELVNNLETAVSCGWMGVAAEISDYLQTAATTFLDTNPELRMKVEIERLKRFAYMGFEAATKSAGERVLSFIQAHESALEHDDKLVWESVAVTSAAWFASNPRDLDPIIDRCQKIDTRFGRACAIRDLCASFMIGIEGRRAALSGDTVGCKEKFKKACDLCRKHSSKTPLAHLIIHYAESLGIAEDWEAALKLARDFLTTSLKDEKRPFRSHLLLRAIFLILRAPSELVTDTEVEFLAFRYRLLVYAMGMEEAENLYPVLGKIQSRILKRCKITKPDLYSMFLPGPILDRINAFGGPSHEHLLSLYYAANSYTVKEMGGSCPGVDLLIWKSPKKVIAIQAKSTNRESRPGRPEMGKTDIPDEDTLDEAKRHIERIYGITSISSFWWHCVNKLNYRAEQVLKKRVTDCFGHQCEVEQKLNRDLAEELVAPKYIALLQRIWTNEFKLDQKRLAAKQKRAANAGNGAKKN